MLQCWHRPGRVTRRGSVLCRYCSVQIDWCPCVDVTFRHVNHDCGACFGSMWVAVVRGWRSKLWELAA